MTKAQLAEAVACYAHQGQLDKAGQPYIGHPRAVAAQVEGDTAKAAAFLHDVLEDTFVTEATIRNLFGDTVADTVCTLTRREGETYASYIRRVGEDSLARQIKLADLCHNMDLTRLPRVTERDRSRAEKYRKAAAYLRAKNPESP